MSLKDGQKKAIDNQLNTTVSYNSSENRNTIW